MKNVIIQNPENGDHLRRFIDGSERNVADLPSAFIGKGTYKPGWMWSKHAGPQTGKSSEGHIGYILSGRMVTKAPTGKEVTAGPGDAFEVGPNHDAWVFGDEPCVALDFEAK